MMIRISLNNHNNKISRLSNGTDYNNYENDCSITSDNDSTTYSMKSCMNNLVMTVVLLVLLLLQLIIVVETYLTA